MRVKVFAHIQPAFEVLVKSGLLGKIISDDQFQIFLKEFAQDVLTILDEQVEEGHRQETVPISGLLHHDLSQDEGRQVFLGFGIKDLHLPACSDQVGNLVQGDVGFPFRVIQSPAGVSLEQHLLGHFVLLPGHARTVLVPSCNEKKLQKKIIWRLLRLTIEKVSEKINV